MSLSVCQESPSSWLDSALSHISEIIQLEDVPSIQMEVGVLVREFPDVRYEHIEQAHLLAVCSGTTQTLLSVQLKLTDWELCW